MPAPIQAKRRFQKHLVVSTVIFISSVVLVIFGAAYYVTRSMDARMEQEVTWFSQSVSQQVSDQIELLATRSLETRADSNTLRQALKAYMDSEVESIPALYYLRLENLEGQVLTQSFKQSIPPEDLDLLNRGTLKPRQARSQFLELGQGENQLRVRDYGTPIRLNERSMGQLRLGISIDYLNDRMATIRNEIYQRAILLSTIAVAIFTTLFFYVRWLVKRAQGLEAQAHEADRLAYLGTLAGGLAHEIRNPLSAMNLNLQMIEEEVKTSSPKDAELPTLFESTKREIKRLERLSTSFLTYARPLPTRLDRINLKELMGNLCGDFKSQLTALGIQFVCDLDAIEDATVQGDRDLLKQALLNILINAKDAVVEARRDNSEVQVSFRKLDAQYEIDIADNGIGIAPEQKNRIFEIFFSNKRGGTGLGLPIAQQIIEHHGGRIEVESEPAQFTRFKILLPV